jgi:hypothetical protein
LIALILVALIPMVFFAGVIVLNLGREQRMSVERGSQTTVRALAIAVERELAASIRALEVLATSDLLSRGDLAAFHARATRAVDAQDVWYVLALTDPSGRLLLNTARPFGASLPRIGDGDSRWSPPRRDTRRSAARSPPGLGDDRDIRELFLGQHAAMPSAAGMIYHRDPAAALAVAPEGRAADGG